MVFPLIPVVAVIGASGLAGGLVYAGKEFGEEVGQEVGQTSKTVIILAVVAVIAFIIAKKQRWL